MTDEHPSSGSVKRVRSDRRGDGLVGLVLSRSPFRRYPALGLAFSVAAFAGAVAARSVYGGPEQVPFLLLYPALVLTALLAGTLPAILLTLLGGAWTLWSGGAAQSAVVVFVLFGALLIYLTNALAELTVSLSAERRMSEGLLSEQRVMFAELQHRVANNLTFLASLLRLSRKQVQENPATAAEAYDDAIRRLEVISRLHRRLHTPEALQQPLPHYLRSLCTDLLDATGAQNIVCLVDADDVRLSLPKLTALSLLLVELMTNSIKHAFMERETGTIEIDLRTGSDGKARLVVSDDGPGVPDTQVAPAGAGLGLKIIEGLAQQLGAELRLPARGSAKTEVLFPI
jgi:two-component sensor histidine kinase